MRHLIARCICHVRLCGVPVQGQRWLGECGLCCEGKGDGGAWSAVSASNLGSHFKLPVCVLAILCTHLSVCKPLLCASYEGHAASNTLLFCHPPTQGCQNCMAIVKEQGSALEAPAAARATCLSCVVRGLDAWACGQCTLKKTDAARRACVDCMASGQNAWSCYSS